MTKSVLFAIVLAFVSTAASAQTFELTIKNGFVEAMTGFSVAGAKVEGFKQVAAAGKRQVSVALPDGKCEAAITVTFADGQQLDAGAFNFCESDTFAVEF